MSVRGERRVRVASTYPEYLEVNAINRRNTTICIVVTLLLIAAFVLPASAAPVTHAQSGAAVRVNKTLRNELWDARTDYRLRIFDAHVDLAGDVIKILNKHDYETDQLSAILAQIEENRTALKSALEDHNRQELRSINMELRSLWVEFLKTIRNIIRPPK